jgi:hypothetical protein
VSPFSFSAAKYDGNARSLSLEEFTRLPTQVADPGQWSAFQRVMHARREDEAFTVTTLRRAVIRELNAMTAERKTGAPPPGNEKERPSTSDTPAMVDNYERIMEGSALKDLFTKDLSKDQQHTSPLSAEEHWHAHQGTCEQCKLLPSSWQQYRAQNHRNPCFISTLLAILHHGFVPAFEKEPAAFYFKNSSSLKQAPESVAAEQAKAVVFGAVEEEDSQFISPLLDALREHHVLEQLEQLRSVGVTPMEVWEKDLDALNAAIAAHRHLDPCLKPVKTRLCLDLSREVNPHLRKWGLSYEGVPHALRLVSRGCFMAKIDLASMFWQIPLHKKVQKYFAYRHNNKSFVCRRMPFGASPAPALANTLTGFLSNLLTSMGIPNVIMTDDIFIVGDTEAVCNARVERALVAVRRLGWQVNPDKVEAAAQVMSFLGMEIDSVNGTVAIPHSRVLSNLQTVERLLRKHTAKVEDIKASEVERVAGLLEWFTTVMPAGRPFIAGLHTTTGGKHGNTRVFLSAAALADLNWWLPQLQRIVSSPKRAPWSRIWRHGAIKAIRIFSDASGTTGWGAVCMDTVYEAKWFSPPDQEPDFSSCSIELAPLLEVLRRQGPALRDSVVVATTDNLANAFALNKGASSNFVIRELLQLIAFECNRYNITLVGDWVDRNTNQLLDDFSKQVFSQQVALAKAHLATSSGTPSISLEK